MNGILTTFLSSQPDFFMTYILISIVGAMLAIVQLYDHIKLQYTNKLYMSPKVMIEILLYVILLGNIVSIIIFSLTFNN